MCKQKLHEPFARVRGAGRKAVAFPRSGCFVSGNFRPRLHRLHRCLNVFRPVAPILLLLTRRNLGACPRVLQRTRESTCLRSWMQTQGGWFWRVRQKIAASLSFESVRSRARLRHGLVSIQSCLRTVSAWRGERFPTESGTIGSPSYRARDRRVDCEGEQRFRRVRQKCPSLTADTRIQVVRHDTTSVVPCQHETATTAVPASWSLPWRSTGGGGRSRNDHSRASASRSRQTARPSLA